MYFSSIDRSLILPNLLLYFQDIRSYGRRNTPSLIYSYGVDGRGFLKSDLKEKSKYLFINFNIMRFFILLLGIFILQSCNKEGIMQEDGSNKNVKIANLKNVHDEYCQMIYDSIMLWKSNHVLNKNKIIVVWESMVSQLSKNLEVNQSDVISLYNRLDISSKNYGTIRNDKYELLEEKYKLLIDDINNIFNSNLSVPDKVLLDKFEERKNYWNNEIDPSIVFNTFEVAKSSYVFWRAHFADINTKITRSEPCPQGAGKLATGDVVGGIWGGIFGGPGGWLVGSVGGTLGATIQGAIYGFGCKSEKKYKTTDKVRK